MSQPTEGASAAETQAFNEAFQQAAAHFSHLTPAQPDFSNMPPLVIRNGKFSL